MINKNIRYNRLINLSIIISFIGAVGSLFFMFKVGHNNKSSILKGLFTVWVVSPFIALILKCVASYSSRSTNQSILWVTVIITIFSLITYSRLLPIGTKPAFVYLFNPFVSWIIIILSQFIKKKDYHINNKEAL